MTKFQLYCSCIVCRLSTTVQNLNRHSVKHTIKPTICPECNSITDNKKFCSKSCAAIYNNKNRKPESILKQKASLTASNATKRSLLPKPIKVKKQKLKKYRTCIDCGRIDETTGRFQSNQCMYCNDSLTYRESCKFTFNVKDYPAEFDLSLLSVGMFNPKFNKQGVSKDHMLSISYGKQNKIDPRIMSHPANCRLMLQTENKAKQHHSSLTLAELLERILQWNQKYP